MTMHRWSSLGEVYVAPPPAPSNRSFGLTVGGVLAAAALLSVWRGHTSQAVGASVVAALLIAAALIRPAALQPLAKVWGRIGHALGWLNSRILLTVLFVVIIWPIGMLSRLFGSDPLGRRRGGDSFWTAYRERLRDRAHYERLY
jgi:hypothetical protein